MAKDETAAGRNLRLAKVAHAFHEIDVPKDRKTSALDMAQASGLDPARLFKTLIVTTSEAKLATAIVPADKDLDRKALAKHLKTKRVDLADQKHAEKITGYKAGAISPVGQKKQLPTFLDESAQTFDTIYVSGGRWGLELEIAPNDLIKATRGTLCLIALP